VEKEHKGTEIVIEHLRDRWSEKAITNLTEYLGRTYNDDVMKIIITYNQKEYPVSRYFVNPRLGENFSASIDIKYISEIKMLECTIKSEEFKDEAEKYCPSMDIHYYMNSINMLDEFANEDFDDEIEDLEMVLSQLGDFNANLYFGLERVLPGDDEKFLYKSESGVILYRNSFSISSYEGKKDWLSLLMN